MPAPIITRPVQGTAPNKFITIEQDQAELQRVVDALYGTANPEDRERAEDAADRAETAQTAAELAETNAETAETNAELAQVASETARTQAELAAIAAGATIYDTIANGLAGSADGDVFLVATEPGVKVYRDDAGTETLLGWLGDVLFDNVATLLASTSTFATGTITRTREEGFAYKAVASGGHVQNSASPTPQEFEVLAGRDIRISALDLSSSVPPSTVESLLDAASVAGVSLVFDADVTLSGDVLVDKKVKIVLAPSVTISIASPTYDNGIATATSIFYAAGLFTFRAGSEGSVFEAHGTFDVAGGSGTVGGETVHKAAVLVYGTERVTLRGRPQVINSFNGVTCVDSDYFRMEEPWHGVNLTNAVLDAEASDHGYAVASGEGCEEVIDMQYSNVDWDVWVNGEGITQGTLEINNSHNIRVNVVARNCRALEVNEYVDSSLIRWSGRAREYPDNRDCYVKSTLLIDSSYVGPPALPFHNLRRGTNISLDATIDIRGVDPQGSLIGIGGSDFVGGRISVKTKSDTRLSVTPYGVSGEELYFEHDTEIPMNTGDAAVICNAATDSTVKTLRMDGGGAGINVKMDIRGTRLRLVDAHHAINVDKTIDFGALGGSSATGPIYVEPALKVPLADLPSGGLLCFEIGQKYDDPETRRTITYLGDTLEGFGGWDYTDRAIVATAFSGTRLHFGFNAVTGGDGSNGVRLPNTSVDTFGHIFTVHNADATNAINIWTPDSAQLIDGATRPYVLAAGDTISLRAYGSNWIKVT